MTTLRTTVVVLLGFYTFCQETRASVPGASVLGRPLLYGPSTALEKTVEEFQCEVLRYPKEESLLYQLFREGDRSKALGFYSALSGEKANFPLFITASYEGYMVCVASVQNNTVIHPTVSQRHHLRVVDPVNGAEVVVQSGSVEFYEGKPLSLRCNIAKGTHVSYQWLVDGKPLPLSPLHNQTQEQLFIYRMVPQDSGEYTCVATNQLNITTVYSSRSTAKVIKVKGQGQGSFVSHNYGLKWSLSHVHIFYIIFGEVSGLYSIKPCIQMISCSKLSPSILSSLSELVSEPDLLFLVLKKRGGTYFALVTCQSLNGTPPITFSLYNRSEFISTETVDERFATFSIPVVLDLHMGFLQCQAQNGDRVVYSQWTAMHVVPVGGALTMHYDTDVGENFSIVGLRFYCSVERGTFPQYRWFLNGTVLEGRGEFYWVENQPEQSILLLSVGRSSAGTYHCEVSDSFDDTTVISSEAMYIDKKVLNHLPTTVVAVVFGCFLFLVTLVTTCCFIGLLYQKRQYLVEKSTLDLKLGLEMHNIMVSDDDEEFLGRQCIMDEEEYMEDDGVVRAARIVDSDQEEVESTDEWLQLHQELKNTLEDEIPQNNF
ncbi:platelet endothelial cell adhesion molecule [Oncorhynchus keta]|uniref:platelet endothelial cell adhesion molecule n=1 Tax=Oncorhynchus keta TaxID=8018 RepID=UPI00227A7F31|nr:platelet endothelial cell adhesion molecule [Oncorhynchus keta]